MAMKTLAMAAFAVLGASLPAGNALAIEDATPAEPARRRELSETLAASVNNLGLQNVLELSWTRPLSASRNPLLSGAHTAFGVSHTLTPSYTRMGAWAELSPLSVLDLRVGVEPTVYFGTFHSLMSFDSYGDSFTNDARDLRGGAGFGTAGRVYLSPTLKSKAGPVVAVAGADFEWWRSRAQGPLFYEPARDTLLKASGDRLLNTSSALLYQYDVGLRGQLAAGLIHQLTYVYAAPANQIQRLGVLVVRQFGAKRFGLSHPRLLATVAYYLDDPSKKHQLSAAVALCFKSTR
jgi:hypothetical protein